MTLSLLLVLSSQLLALGFAAPVDPETAKAYRQIHSAFIDLDRYAAPPSKAEVELGRLLFFDPRLSKAGTMSCATCHDPAKAWADGRARARGGDGKDLPRNTPSLFNINRNIPFLYFWDGRADTMEQAATIALRSRVEMDSDPRELITRLARVPAYTKAFREIYGTLTEENAIKAIAAFLKTELRAEPAPFDRFADDPAALSEPARRGMKVFVGKGRCMQCHNGPFFSDDFFHNVGLKPVPGLDDPGRYELTKLKQNRRAFRTPPLRNVALTAPYMHDGSLATLREVIEFYSRGGDVAEDRDPEMLKLDLTPGEQEDLLAFLESLTSPLKKVERPKLPKDDTGADPGTPSTENVNPGATSPSPASPGAVATAVTPACEPPTADLLKMHRFQALVERAPAACDGLRGITDAYRGVARPADLLCREWNRQDELNRALITRAPDLEQRCVDFLSNEHDNRKLPRAQAAEACRILASHADAPHEACAALVPKYLGKMQAGTCEAQFRRLAPKAPASTCGDMEGQPGEHRKRCLELNDFNRAFWSKDPSACKDGEMCRALLGDRTGSVDKAAARVKASACPPAVVPSTAAEPGCLPDFELERFTRDAAAGTFGAKSERVKESVNRDLLLAWEFKVLIAGDPAGCAALKGHSKNYAGVVKPADEVCRERYYEDKLQHDLITKSPDLVKNCTQSLLHSYDYAKMTESDATAACTILAANADDPAAACAKLVPRFLGEMKIASCVNIILRLKPRQDPAICRNLEGQPKDWMGRCLGLSAFNNAFWKKDAGLCGEDELCRAMMGDAQRSVARAAARVRLLACNALKAKD